MSDELEQFEKAVMANDESTLVNITVSHSNEERVKLRADYQAKFGRDLLKDFESKLKSDFKECMLGLYKPPAEYDADLLYFAMKGIGSDKEVITEVLSFRTPERLNEVKAKFQEKYGKDLVAEIKSETSGDYQKTVMLMLEHDRNKNNNPDLEKCKKIAEELYNAGENKFGTNESVFIKYFTSLSAKELQLVSKEYHKNYKKNIVQVIENEFSGILKNLFKNILYGLYNPAEYYARKIYEAVDGIGTADEQLIRCIVTRCEIDIKLIKRYFKQIFKKDMVQRIKENCSSKYQKLLESIMSKK